MAQNYLVPVWDCQKIGVQVGNHLDHPSHEKHYFNPSIVEAKVWPVTRVIA